MLTILAVIHLLIGLALVMFVLLQDPKGGAMGVFSGGSSSNSFFGASGASNFLSTTTRWLAVAFAISCLVLTYMTSKRGGSVMDAYTPGAASAPATTEPAAGASEGTDAAAPTATEAAPATAPAVPAEAPKK
jgi:preprotein translocase subunit SecG